MLVPLGALALVLAGVIAQRAGFFQTVIEARTQPGGSSTQTHLEFYSLIRPALEQHLFFGLGLNTFASYYEFLTGESNYGPHSYYVALLTETGLVGTALYGAWLVYLFARLARAPPAGAGAGPPRRRACRAGPAAGLGDDRGARSGRSPRTSST